MFEPVALAGFAGAYPERACAVAHDLAGHTSLSLPRLMVLAGSLPRAHIIRRAGDLDLGAYDTTMALGEMSPALLVQSLNHHPSILHFSDIGDEREFKALMSEVLRTLRPLLKAAGNPALGVTTHIHLAAPGTVLPLHLAVQHRLHLQVRGQSTLSYLDPVTAAGVTSAELEAGFHDGKLGLAFDPAFEEIATHMPLNEGDGVYLPPGTPVWVRHGDSTAMGLDLRWRSAMSLQRADCYGFHRVTRRFGLKWNVTKGGAACAAKAQLYGLIKGKPKTAL